MSGAITPVLTTVLVLVTIYYAWQTRQTVKAMNEANEANNRPVVSVSLQDRVESISFMDLVITNAGNGLARDISFKVKGKNFLVNDVGGEKIYLKDFRPIKHGLNVLAPKETRKYWFISVMGRVDELQSIKTSLEVIYHNHDRSKEYSDVFQIDFMATPEYGLGVEPLYKLSKESEKIRKELEQINRSLERST